MQIGARWLKFARTYLNRAMTAFADSSWFMNLEEKTRKISLAFMEKIVDFLILDRFVRD